MHPTVVITHQIPTDGLGSLYEQAQVVYPENQSFFDQTDLLAFAPKANAILAVGPLSAAFIDAAPGLRVISNYGAGYDGIDVAAATRRGIPVVTLPEGVERPTAELAMGLMLMAARRLGEMNTAMRLQSPSSLFGIGRNMGHTLAGKVLGIVGMGHIGRRVAALARAFGMTICYQNRHRLPEDLEQGAKYLPLSSLLKTCDILTLHCPLTEETRGLIGMTQLRRMRPGSFLINTARGGIVDYDALADALESGHLLGAGLDVYPEEPDVPARLVALPQVVMTPHHGSNTFEDRKEMAQIASRNILSVLSGGRPAGIINPEALRG